MDYQQAHSPEGIAEYLNGVFEYSKVVYGDINKKQGDVVIINLKKNEEVPFEEYIKYCRLVDRIETIGRYTNLYYSPKYFGEIIKKILNQK